MPTATRSALAALAAVGALTVAACTSSSGEGRSTGPTSTTPSTPARTAGTTVLSSTSPATATPLLRSTRLTGEDTVIAFTQTFVKALYTRGINTRPTGSAGLDDYHRARLPITGGSATLYPGASALTRNQASLAHSDSGLTVYTTGQRVSVSAITLTLGAEPAISAVVAQQSAAGRGGSRVTLFDLTLTRGATKTSGGVVLGAMRAELDPAGARVLDRAFSSSVFASYTGRAAGTVAVTLTG